MLSWPCPSVASPFSAGAGVHSGRQGRLPGAEGQGHEPSFLRHTCCGRCLLLTGGARGRGGRSRDCLPKVGRGDSQAQPASRAEQGPQTMALIVLEPLPSTWTTLRGSWAPRDPPPAASQTRWGLDYSPINHQGFRVRPGNLLVCLIRPLH